jgi:hypothetical protein
MNELLVMRTYPLKIQKYPSYNNLFSSMFGDGASIDLNGHPIHFFYPGYGKSIRKIPQA